MKLKDGDAVQRVVAMRPQFVLPEEATPPAKAKPSAGGASNGNKPPAAKAEKNGKAPKGKAPKPAAKSGRKKAKPAGRKQLGFNLK